MSLRLAFPVTAALAMAGVVAPAAGAHDVPYATGTYTATTAQHTTFRFRIVAHTAHNHCGSKAGAHCFVALSNPSINETCSDGTSDNAGLFDVPDGSISSTGHFAYHQAVAGSNPLIDFRMHAVGSKVSGSYREKDPAGGAGGMLTCDSGSVLFHATRS
jgi:hypothetical protein